MEEQRTWKLKKQQMKERTNLELIEQQTWK